MVWWTVIYNNYKVWDVLQVKYDNVAGIRKKDWAIRITSNKYMGTDYWFVVYPWRHWWFLDFYKDRRITTNDNKTNTELEYYNLDNQSISE